MIEVQQVIEEYLRINFPRSYHKTKVEIVREEVPYILVTTSMTLVFNGNSLEDQFRKKLLRVVDNRLGVQVCLVVCRI